VKKQKIHRADSKYGQSLTQKEYDEIFDKESSFYQK